MSVALKWRKKERERKKERRLLPQLQFSPHHNYTEISDGEQVDVKNYFFFFFLVSLGLHLWHMEVPRLGVELEL